MRIRQITALLALVVFGVNLSKSTAADDSPTKAKLERAKANFEDEMRAYAKAVNGYFDQREEAARKDGNKKLVDQIKAERQAFLDKGELPKFMPSEIKQRAIFARSSMIAAYDAAIKAFTREKQDTEAGNAEKEFEEFKKAAGALKGNEVENSKKDYEKAVKASEKTLLGAFDKVLAALPTTRMMKPQERLRMIDVVTIEKATFESAGRIPLSASMRSAAEAYVRTTTTARLKLSGSFSKAIGDCTRKKELEQARAYSEQKHKVLMPKVLSVWAYDIAPRVTQRWELLSDGTLNGGPATWSISKGMLVITGPDPKGIGSGVRGVPWIDTCSISADGKTVIGSNRLGHPKRGVLIEK